MSPDEIMAALVRNGCAPTRGTRITDALLAPPTGSASEAARDAVRGRLLATVPRLVERLPVGSQVTIGLPQLRRLARGEGVPTVPEEPFTWKPAFVRRSLGLATVEACLDHQHRWGPTRAVGPVADRAVAEWQRTGWQTYHWEPWFAGLGPGARSAVLAEAGTWAAALWTALDWRRFPVPPRLGGPDDQWVCAAPRTVRLRGRCELRAALVGEPTGLHAPPVIGTALVSVASGVPDHREGEAELAFLALVAALRSPSRPVPDRVVGLWLQSDRFRVVEITDELLDEAASRVVAAIEAVVAAGEVTPAG